MKSLIEQIVALTSRLVERPSVSPFDCGCQAILAERLEAQGFQVQALPFGDVENIWATHGNGNPLVLFAGHTDVVPTGPVESWRFDPFTPTIDGNLLYGRGSADMKGSLAAMVAATERFLERQPQHIGSIAFLVTSDEESDAIDGTDKVVDWLASHDIRPEYCVVGEPSSTTEVGDVIRIGRRGSLNGHLTVVGRQGHVAYPDQARNPIHDALAVLQTMATTRWDDGNEAFPPTSFQISNIQAGTGAPNVIPGELSVDFNLRFSTEQTNAGLRQRISTLLDQSALEYRLDWRLSGEPFLTAGPALINAVRDSVREVQDFEPELSTGGGTSDGRFIARLGTQIVELGPVNTTIHSVDECAHIGELAKLSNMYLDILNRLLPATNG